jgi:hypothetical protein
MKCFCEVLYTFSELTYLLTYLLLTYLLTYLLTHSLNGAGCYLKS